MRIVFPLILLGVLLLVCAIIDQIFVRTLRLFLSHHAANVIRFSLMAFWTILIAGNIAWGHYHTRLTLQINNVEIENNKLPASFSGLKVAHISDLHIGSLNSPEGKQFLSEIADTLIAQKPDIICFSGDLVTIRSAELIPFLPQLSRLSAAGIPVYSVMGNHDYADYLWDFSPEQKQEDRDSLRLMQRQIGWQMLDNEATVLRRGEDSIAVIGVENIGEPPFTTYGNLQNAMQSLGDNVTSKNMFSILLSHNPTHWRSEVLPNTDIDLTLSGHTHDWQFRILGWTPSKYKYPDHGGLYQNGSQYMYVNTGLGCTGPTVRIGVKPEITIITIVTAQ